MNIQFERPQNLTDALHLMDELSKANQRYTLSSGGTDVLPLLKQHELKGLTLISLSGVKQLEGVSIENNGALLRIGARTTLAEIQNHPDIKKHLPFLAETAAKVASPQIRNRATIAGNLLVNHRCVYFNQSEQNRQTHKSCFKADGDVCHLVPNARRDRLPVCRARFVSDCAAVLLVLNAKVQVISSRGQRSIDLQDFYVQDGIERNKLAEGEIVTAINIGLPVQQSIQYEKLRIRNAIDFPSVGVAVGVTKSKDLSVCVIGLNMHPILLRFDAQKFSGLESAAEAACAEATKLAQPLKQDFFPPAYRRKMISVLIRRSLEKTKGS